MALGEDDETRRRYLTSLASLAAVAGGNILYFSGRDENERTDPSVIIYRGGETYEGDPDKIEYDIDPNDENIDTWEELDLGECNLEDDEQEWLVSRMDEYDNLEQDEFFDYVGREVRLEQRGEELRMTIDSDYSGDFDADTHYVVDKGYNVPDSC